MVTNQDRQIHPVQVRMARAALGLGVRELAMLTDMSPNTIARFERGESMQRRTVAAIQVALEEAGVEFLSTDGRIGVTAPSPDSP